MDDIKIRVIDSKKLIEAINTGSYEINLSAVMALGAVATQSASQWIPVTERLPRDEKNVIVSIHDDSGDYACDYTSSGWYTAAGEFWVVDNEINGYVIAWMPLPEPWKGVMRHEGHD